MVTTGGRTDRGDRGGSEPPPSFDRVRGEGMFFTYVASRFAGPGGGTRQDRPCRHVSIQAGSPWRATRPLLARELLLTIKCYHIVPSYPKDPSMIRSNAALRRLSALPALAFCLLAAAAPARANVLKADRVVVLKKERLLMLLKNGEVLRSYRVALGRQPGAKSRQGDGRTPEGLYVLDFRNERSKFYRALHISYPNAADLAAARKNGVSPGRDVMIHGLPKGFEDLADDHTERNWTKGCIAVNNAEIDEIWRLVPNGTPIEIKP